MPKEILKHRNKAEILKEEIEKIIDFSDLAVGSEKYKAVMKARSFAIERENEFWFNFLNTETTEVPILRIELSQITDDVDLLRKNSSQDFLGQFNPLNEWLSRGGLMEGEKWTRGAKLRQLDLVLESHGISLAEDVGLPLSRI